MSWNPFKKNDEQAETEALTATPAVTASSSTPAPAATAPSSTPAPATTAPASAAPAAEPGSRTPAELHHDIVEVLKTIYDPEIPVNIYELSLIYDIDIQESGDTHIKMTLTSPMCPVAGSLPPEVETKVRTVAGIGQVQVELVWEPAWAPSMLNEAVKLQLGLM
jgi:FeS assembly SUF system protein